MHQLCYAVCYNRYNRISGELLSVFTFGLKDKGLIPVTLQTVSQISTTELVSKMLQNVAVSSCIYTCFLTCQTQYDVRLITATLLMCLCLR